MLTALAAAIIAPAPLGASIVLPLTPSALGARADAVVDATVLDVRSSWNAAHDGLETTVELAVERVVAGRAPSRVRVLQPGGAIGTSRQIVAGMPEFAIGERARLFLRRLPPGWAGRAITDADFRVLGWWQGKWRRLGTSSAGEPLYAPPDAAPPDAVEVPAGVLSPSLLGAAGALAPINPIGSSESSAAGNASPGANRPIGFGPLRYSTNGMVWPESKIPVRYLINRRGTGDVPLPDAREAIHAAFRTWQDVPCSRLAYSYAGETDLGVAVDGQNVILWIEKQADWIYGEEAAAATSTWIPIPEERTADVAFNGVYFDWAVAPPGSAAPHTLDIQAVLVHELGHFSGLGHTESSIDTMYFGWRPWPGQRTLSADDRRGICSVYPRPSPVDECARDADCPAGEACKRYEQGTLCTGTPDPIGAACSYDRVECEHFCLYTAADLSSGYCSRFCESDGDCPPTHHCAAASAGSQTVHVCFTGPPRKPDGGVAMDAGIACGAGEACPAGQHCGAGGRCTFECRAASDCPSGMCSGDGRCVADGGGCGCRVGGRGGDAGAWVLWMAAALVLCIGWALRGRAGARRR